MVEGDVSIEQLIERQDKDWLGIDNWRKRLEGAGLSRAIAKVLALEQGQTDRLCEYSPKELLRLVFDVFGDQEVLDRYDEARNHQRQLSQEVEAAERELCARQGPTRRSWMSRVNLFRQYEAQVPGARNPRHRGRARAEQPRDPPRARRQAARTAPTSACNRPKTAASTPRSRPTCCNACKTRATPPPASKRSKPRCAPHDELQEEAREAERPVEALVKRADELQRPGRGRRRR